MLVSDCTQSGPRKLSVQFWTLCLNLIALEAKKKIKPMASENKCLSFSQKKHFCNDFLNYE